MVNFSENIKNFIKNRFNLHFDTKDFMDNLLLQLQTLNINLFIVYIKKYALYLLYKYDHNIAMLTSCVQ